MAPDEKEIVVDEYLKGLKKKLLKSIGFTVSDSYHDIEYMQNKQYQRDVLGENIAFDIRYK